MRVKVVRIIVLLSLVMGAFGSLFAIPTGSASADSSTTSNASICIVTTPDTQNYPEVSLDIRALDQRLNNIPNVSASIISVADNGKTVAPTELVSNTAGAGADVYFLIDQGNRTNQTLVRSLMKRFGEKFMIDGKDRVTIITDLTDGKRNNPYVYLPLTTSIADFLSAVNNLPSESAKAYVTTYDAQTAALNQLRGDSTNGCSRPRYIVAIMGDDEINSTEINKITALAIQLRVPIHVVHVARDNAFNSSYEYQRLADSTYGTYVQVSQGKEGDTQLDQNVFSNIQNSRQTYSLKYRSAEGSSGNHSVSVQWSSQPLATSTNTTEYSIDLSPATITMVTPTEGSILERTATQQSVNGFLYDIDSETIQFTADWTDGHPRNIVAAELLVKNQKGTEMSVAMQPSNQGALTFEWDMRELGTEGDNPVTLQVKATDELGLTSLSQPVSLIVRNTIPTGLAGAIADPVTRIILIGLALIVVVLIVLVIKFRKQLSTFASSGAVGNAINQVRKTILGGAKRGKPLVMLKVLEGPKNLVGEELKVYADSVKLGRDPAQAQYTFYSDTESSVSGLHARLERVNGQWRLVAISKSGQETFIDGRAIPMMEPCPIHDGQVIRLGYPAQQCVELEFNLVSSSESEKPINMTDLSREEGGKRRVTKLTDPAPEDDLDLQTISDLKKGNGKNSDDFDDFFQSLRDQ